MAGIDADSVLGDHASLDSVPPALEWLEQRRIASRLAVRPVSLSECRGWLLADGELRHRTGRYFQVVGARGSNGEYVGWRRPMVRQDEIGLLGYVVTPRDGSIEWLVQAKTEPGNISGTQLAPTVQATESNQDRVHGGSPVRHLELFAGADEGVAGPRTLSDLLASEQGTRFLGKRNRNSIIMVDAPTAPPAEGAWRWLDRAVVRHLLARDFVVNTDARSVVASGPWSVLADDSHPFAALAGRKGFRGRLLPSYETPATIDAVLQELATRRATAEPMVQEIPLTWAGGRRIESRDRAADDELTLVEVEVADREIESWCQPLLADGWTERCDLYAQVRHGIMRFLFRFTAEPGLRNLVELGPTVQTHPGRESGFARARSGATRLSVLQSDEGGRFFKCVVRYRVVEFGPDSRVDDHDGVWLTLSQVEALAAMSGVFTNEARSLISLLLSLA